VGDSPVQGAPLGGLGVRGGARRWRLDGAGRRRRRFNGGEGAPVENRGRGGVGELREDKAKLMVGSAWAEEGCSCGFTATSSSPACRWAAMVF